MLQRHLTILGLLILFVFCGCQENTSLQTDVLASNNLAVKSDYRENINTATEPEKPILSSVAAKYALPPETVYGGIISTQPGQMDAFLNTLPNKDWYTHVVVLAPTAYREAGNKIFTYDSAGTLTDKKIEIDEPVTKKLEENGNIKTLGVVGDKSSWNSGILPEMKKEFPNAGFILLSFNGSLSESEMETAAYMLKSSLPEESIVLALADFDPAINSNLQDFQDKFSGEVLRDFDLDKFDELPVKNTAALKTLAYYLRFDGAKKTANISENNEDFQILYQNGQPDVVRDIFLVGFGDVMLGRYVRTLMDVHGNDYPFEKMDKNYLRVNDILLANLEGPVTDNAIKTSKAIAFRFPAETAALLKKYYFDVFSLANNHALDMGPGGYADSKKYLSGAGLKFFGDPRGINDDSVSRLVVQGQKIAFLGLEEVTYKIDDKKAVETIKNLVSEGYKVIPVVHWGIEYTHKPNARQLDLAHKFIDAGAIMVIGHHPHVVQAYENYNGRPIFYSLGNAVFDQYWSADTQVGLSAAMVISDKDIEIYLVPLNIIRSQVEIMNDVQARKFLEKFVTYGNPVSDEEKNAIMEGHLLLAL